MPLSNPARREQFVAIPKPTAREMDALKEALFWVAEALRDQTEEIDHPDYDPESPMCTAEAFVAVSKLLTELRFAKPVPAPAKEAAKPTPKVAANPRRFDFAALPPRVEAGC